MCGLGGGGGCHTNGARGVRSTTGDRACTQGYPSSYNDYGAYCGLFLGGGRAYARGTSAQGGLYHGATKIGTYVSFRFIRVVRGVYGPMLDCGRRGTENGDGGNINSCPYPLTSIFSFMTCCSSTGYDRRGTGRGFDLFWMACFRDFRLMCVVLLGEKGIGSQYDKFVEGYGW